MAPDQSQLYGKRVEKSQKTTAATFVSSNAFSAQLSSLISQGSQSTSRGRPRPSKGAKSDLFARSNKGSEKRAAADLVEDDHSSGKQVHKRSRDLGDVDDAMLDRSKRKMAEKVQLYNEIKKGAHLAGDSSDDEDAYRRPAGKEDHMARLRRKEKDSLVDFDRKWADEERAKQENPRNYKESDEEIDDNASIISYEDEFGRSRRGTRAEAAIAAREKEEAENPGMVQQSWQPARPDNLIYGDTIQHEAFNPDDDIAARMAYIASRRDRSVTPPELLHYDASGENRSRGTGFYTFSRDEEERQKQMAELKKARDETERHRLQKARSAANYEEFRARSIQGLADLRVERTMVELEEILTDREQRQSMQSDAPMSEQATAENTSAGQTVQQAAEQTTSNQ
ncbi:hypothetical protein N7495_008052 [Penicillium taxi]|uniref:uncharacterized protein n=1 Tax=Penicillium taxi TaxID=168475 RepID=UPI0025457A6B|nr:uncharacterized protein N7495_008052 [Penicillium taxi]KAJ5888011.1 hypothetical protein N7495_008052 [Penicillium taxi]